MENTYRIFAINPGSTSTKIALFDKGECLFTRTVDHDVEELAQFAEISDQLPYRQKMILDILAEEGIDLAGTDAFVGRGGALVGLEGGTYPVNDILLEHARVGFTIKHPAMLGSQIARALAEEYGAKAYVVNPPDVDELIQEARVTGFKNVFRESRGHPLNQKEVALRHAATLGKRYEDCNFVVAHMGGGISISAHRKGRIIDTTDATAGDGPMAPTRAGALPASAIVKQCFSGEYTEKEMQARILKTGGIAEHLGTSDMRDVERLVAEGDGKATLIFNAMVHQIIKYIGAYGAVLHGDVDGILLTGGIVRDKLLVKKVTEGVSFIAPVTVYPGEFEMEALASGAARVLAGEEEPKEYTGVPIWNGLEY